MKAAEVEELIQRMRRVQAKIDGHAGPGCEWQYTFPEGDTTTYILPGMKPPEVVEDEIRELLTWWWNTKDYLKKRAKAVGRSPQSIEDMVNGERPLAICADLANSQKHGGLDPRYKPRSGENPVLSPVTYHANSEKGAIRSIAFAEGGLVVPVLDPEKTEITMEVRNDAGVVIGDVFDLLNRAVLDGRKPSPNCRSRNPAASVAKD